ncbi:gamma-glutamylcyclotransferase [Fundidesulfovibrio butyratiphilus]
MPAPRPTDANTAPSRGFTATPAELGTFVYGSDMHENQIRSICSNPVVVGIARLANHRMAFHGYTPLWDGALETVVPCPGREVWGVIHALGPRDAQRLDAWHDARLDGSGPFFHWPAEVTDTNGVTHKVLLYKKDILGQATLPSREYLEFILEAARRRGLPRDHVAELAAMESRAASYPVPIRPRLLSLDANDSCASCGGLTTG